MSAIAWSIGAFVVGFLLGFLPMWAFHRLYDSRWRPIETAPKTWREILLWVPERGPLYGGALVLGYWVPSQDADLYGEEDALEADFWSSGWDPETDSYIRIEPTHWMPAPKGPLPPRP